MDGYVVEDVDALVQKMLSSLVTSARTLALALTLTLAPAPNPSPEP